MSDQWCKHDGEAILLVEGQNDCHVILALCKAFNVPETFGIYDCGSDAQALKRLNALISGSSPPKIIGLVMDADRPDLAGRWASILNKLSEYNYPLPKSPLPNGTIVEFGSNMPRLGFWLMPNNRVDGMLEDMCIEMINSPALATVEQCLQIAEASGCATFKSVHRSKAFVHTYLAWQDEPGLRLGQAITAHALNSGTSTAQVFAGWLTDLFRIS